MMMVNSIKAEYQGEHFCNDHETRRITGLSRWERERRTRAGTFPPPYRIGERKIAWKYSELMAWMDSQRQVCSPLRLAADEQAKIERPRLRRSAAVQEQPEA